MLMSASQLKAALVDGDSLVLFDCRFHLADPSKGRQQYLEGHLPGAFYLDLDHDLSSPKAAHGGRHPLPDPIALADKLGAAGVTKGVKVCVYDGGEGMAPRAWWLLRYLGHEAVYVLDGGLKAWIEGGNELSTDVPLPKPAHFEVQLQTGMLAPLSEVEAAADNPGQATLVDARAAERYRGDVEPLDPKGGHIPGAKNMPWQDNFGPDGRFLSPAELKEKWVRAVSSHRPVVAYCGSGVTACVNLLAMELAGVKGARLYAGSWSDWCSYDHHTVAVGDEQQTSA